MKLIHYIIYILIAVFSFEVLSAKEESDTLKVLSGIKGADMTLYNLYRGNLQSDRDKAMEYAEMFLSRIDTTAIEPVLAHISDELSEWYEYDKSLFSKALKWRMYSLSAYGKAHDSYNVALTQYRLARVYTNLGQYHNTLKYVSSASGFFEKTRDTTNLIECFNMLGVVYFTCRQYDKAYSWFTKYTDGARRIGDTSKMVLGLNNSAVLAYVLRDSLKAQKLIGESEFLSSAIRDTSKLCKIYLNDISLYLSTGDLSSAAEALEAVKPLLKKPDEYGQYYQNLGIYYASIGDYDNGIDALNASIDTFGCGEFVTKIQHSYGILQNIYALKGDFRNAYDALSKYYQIDINNHNNEIFLDLYKVQSELEMNLEQEKMSRKQNAVILCSLIGLMVLVSVTILFYDKSKRKSLELKQKEEKIASQNEIIELRKMQEYQIDRITDDISKKLTELNSSIKDQSVKNKIFSICRELQNSRDENEWKETTMYIPAFNSDFYQRLIADFPTLTVNERRLCALLNMNMTTKEISEITRQSPHSINIARSRLRNKLNLTGQNITLQEFLTRYNQQS